MKRRAFTLLELCVSGGLLLMVVGILLAMVITAVNSLHLAERRAEVQRGALMLVNRLALELACAHPDSLQLERGLTFLSSRTAAGRLRFAPSGQRLWVRWMTVARRGDRRVVLRQWPINVPVAPALLTPPGEAAGGWSESRLARHIETLEFAADAHGALRLRVLSSFEGARYEVKTVLGTPLSSGG